MLHSAALRQPGSIVAALLLAAEHDRLGLVCLCGGSSTTEPFQLEARCGEPAAAAVVFKSPYLGGFAWGFLGGGEVWGVFGADYFGLCQMHASCSNCRKSSSSSVLAACVLNKCCGCVVQV